MASAHAGTTASPDERSSGAEQVRERQEREAVRGAQGQGHVQGARRQDRQLPGASKKGGKKSGSGGNSSRAARRPRRRRPAARAARPRATAKRKRRPWIPHRSKRLNGYGEDSSRSDCGPRRRAGARLPGSRRACSGPWVFRPNEVTAYANGYRLTVGTRGCRAGLDTLVRDHGGARVGSRSGTRARDQRVLLRPVRGEAFHPEPTESTRDGDRMYLTFADAAGHRHLRGGLRRLPPAGVAALATRDGGGDGRRPADGVGRLRNPAASLRRARWRSQYAPSSSSSSCGRSGAPWVFGHSGAQHVRAAALGHHGRPRAAGGHRSTTIPSLAARSRPRSSHG